MSLTCVNFSSLNWITIRLLYFWKRKKRERVRSRKTKVTDCKSCRCGLETHRSLKQATRLIASYRLKVHTRLSSFMWCNSSLFYFDSLIDSRGSKAVNIVKGFRSSIVVSCSVFHSSQMTHQSFCRMSNTSLLSNGKFACNQSLLILLRQLEPICYGISNKVWPKKLFSNIPDAETVIDPITLQKSRWAENLMSFNCRTDNIKPNMNIKHNCLKLPITISTMPEPTKAFSPFKASRKYLEGISNDFITA